jgi:hypothetical protein
MAKSDVSHLTFQLSAIRIPLSVSFKSNIKSATGQIRRGAHRRVCGL